MYLIIHWKKWSYVRINSSVLFFHQIFSSHFSETDLREWLFEYLVSISVIGILFHFVFDFQSLYSCSPILWTLQYDEWTYKFLAIEIVQEMLNCIIIRKTFLFYRVMKVMQILMPEIHMQKVDMVQGKIFKIIGNPSK